MAGKEEDVVRKDVGRNRYFTPEEAIEYGIIDRIVRPQESVRSALGPHSIFQQLFAVQPWDTGVQGYVACCATPLFVIPTASKIMHLFRTANLAKDPLRFILACQPVHTHVRFCKATRLNIKYSTKNNSYEGNTTQ